MTKAPDETTEHNPYGKIITLLESYASRSPIANSATNMIRRGDCTEWVIRDTMRILLDRHEGLMDFVRGYIETSTLPMYIEK